MRDVRTIILAAVSRRDLWYVSENKGFRFYDRGPFMENCPWSPPLYNFICGYKIDMAIYIYIYTRISGRASRALDSLWHQTWASDLWWQAYNNIIQYLHLRDLAQRCPQTEWTSAVLDVTSKRKRGTRTPIHMHTVLSRPVTHSNQRNTTSRADWEHFYARSEQRTFARLSFNFSLSVNSSIDNEKNYQQYLSKDLEGFGNILDFTIIYNHWEYHEHKKQCNRI